MDKLIKPIERLKGEIEVPGDKSISHRVVFIGSIARGRTKANNFLKAEDCKSSVSAFRDMGINIDIKEKNIVVEGKGLRGLNDPGKELYLGNSGTTMRILPGILAGQNFEATLAGDESLSRRPMDRIIEPLKGMGVDARSKNSNGFPPLIIKGGSVRPATYYTKVASAQVKSCVLFAGLYAKGITALTEPLISRNHTECMLEFFGAKISQKKFTVCIEGDREMTAQELFIPGDISSAAFLIAAACILDGSDLVIRNVGLNPTRIGFLNVLLRMGARIQTMNKKEKVEPYGDIRIKSGRLRATVVKRDEIPLLVDEVPVLAVLAAQTEGETRIEGVGELRVKETDRIFSVTENLKKMGISINADGENLIIKGARKRFNKAVLESFKDHRTAMSMAVAGLYADGVCEIKDTDCINTSFPEFFDILEHLKK